MPNRHQIFITGGTGYIGSRLILRLIVQGHSVRALVRPGSERKLPPGCSAVQGNALDGDSYAPSVDFCDTFIQLVGVPHPSPAKTEEFISIDQRSAMEAIRVATAANASGAKIRHFLYLSVAHPAPMMHAYIQARSACEAKLQSSGLNATILRPWYVLGPGHRWPYPLIPFYWITERLPSTRESARRLGLVTVAEMVNALVVAVENPPQGVRVIEVPDIRTCSSPRP